MVRTSKSAAGQCLFSGAGRPKGASTVRAPSTTSAYTSSSVCRSKPASTWKKSEGKFAGRAAPRSVRRLSIQPLVLAGCLGLGVDAYDEIGSIGARAAASPPFWRHTWDEDDEIVAHRGGGL